MTVVKTSLRSFLAHKGRMALSLVAVLLSVAFVAGTLVFTDTINATFDRLFASTSADVVVTPKAHKDSEQATGKPRTLPASLVQRVRSATGVGKVNVDVDAENITVVDSKGDAISSSNGAPTIGLNWNESPRNPVELTSGHTPKGPTEAMIDADTAKKKHLKIGDPLRVIALPGTFDVHVSGIVTFTTTNPGATLVLFDTATAQRKLLGATGEYTQISLYAKSGVSNDTLKRNVAAEIGTGYDIKTRDEQVKSSQEDFGSFLDIMKWVLLGFALIALLVGTFLIINTFSMLVAQRTRELGLMRAIGASRRQVNRSVLTEALVLGAAGSVLGIGAGIGLAVGLMALMNSMGMNLSTSNLTVKWTTPAVGLAVGILVTVVAAYVPARRAGKVSPMAALRETGVPTSGKASVVRVVMGLVVTGAGAAALAASASSSDAGRGGLLLGAGVLLTLVGAVVIGPLLAGGVIRVLGVVLLRIFGSVGRMAERNALRNPRRTGATAAALMIGISLVAGMAVVGSSMVASANQELDKSVGADLIVMSNVGQITPEVVTAFKSVPQLASVTESKEVNAKVITPDGKTSKKMLSANNPSYADVLRVSTVSGKIEDAYGPGSLSVNEKFADSHNVDLGSKVKVAFAGGQTAELTVQAITSDDTSLDQGAMYISLDTVSKYLPADHMPLDWALFGQAKDGQEEQAYQAAQQTLHKYPQVKVRDQGDYKNMVKDQVGSMLNLIYGLLALAIIVAILGVVNTLALSVVERTREIGLLRAIGLSRRQMRRMIRLESVVIALFGAVLGLALGLAWGTVAQQLLATQGLNVLSIPWPTIIAVFAGAALVGLLAALIPAFRASRMNVLAAIATE